MVLNANALELPLPDESVDLIITSPPYFALRSYRDGDEHYGGQVGSEPTPQDFLEALWAATAEMVRVLKPSGSIWVNLGDKYAGSGGHNNNGIGSSTLGHHKGGGGPHSTKMQATRRNAPDRYNQNSGGIPAKSLLGLPWRYAIGCVDQLGLILRAEIIWSKPNGMPESVVDRVRRSHETWFHFVKQGRYFAAVDEIREAHTSRFRPVALEPLHTRDPGRVRQPGNTPLKTESMGCNPLGKAPGSVWTIPSEPLIIPDAVKAHYDLPDHFAAFPQEWPRRIILGWSPSGVCVACGEGRRPVVEKERVPLQETNNNRPDDWAMAATWAAGRNGRSHSEAAITGHACSCPEPTADTTPAVILDPFGGTGTVAMVARALGRYGVSVDLSQDYCRLAEWRIFQSGHAAKAEGRTNRERQQTMFGDVA